MRELESNRSRSLVECTLPVNAAEATLWDAERVSPRGTRGRTSRGARPTAAVSEAGSGPGWVLVCGGVGVGLRQCGVAATAGEGLRAGCAERLYCPQRGLAK